MKKIFASLVIAMAAAAFCYADCQPPVPGQVDSPPCTGAATFTDDVEGAATATEATESSTTVVSESSVDDFMTGILLEIFLQ